MKNHKITTKETFVMKSMHDCDVHLRYTECSCGFCTNTSLDSHTTIKMHFSTVKQTFVMRHELREIETHIHESIYES